jgi:hypothetical protein
VVKAGALRIGAFRTDPRHADAVERVQRWTREQFGLSQNTTVMVTELVCTRPGCPPLETLVAFWLDDDQRRHFKVFKATVEVVPGDLPPGWLKDVLYAERDDELDCC